MAMVRTVLGDIDAADLGVCYAHEHLIIDASFTTVLFPDFLLDSVEAGVAELKDFFAAGGRAMVDSMPADSGRNVRKLAEISRRTGVHIICPTGLHLVKYYPPGHWGPRCTAEQLAELFVADITQGVDANDYGAPWIERTAHRAGVIKVAGGKDVLSPFERTLFQAAALAQRATGCPILTHTEEGTAGLEQIEILHRHGANLQHVVLSHTDRKPELAYHRALLCTGVKLEYDSCFRWKADQPNHSLDLLVELLPEFPDQIMVGMDAARRGYWKHYGGRPGLTFLLDTFVPRLRAAGVCDDLLNRMLVRTPAATYAFDSTLT